MTAMKQTDEFEQMVRDLGIEGSLPSADVTSRATDSAELDKVLEAKVAEIRERYGLSSTPTTETANPATSLSDAEFGSAMKIDIRGMAQEGSIAEIKTENAGSDLKGLARKVFAAFAIGLTAVGVFKYSERIKSLLPDVSWKSKTEGKTPTRIETTELEAAVLKVADSTLGTITEDEYRKIARALKSDKTGKDQSAAARGLEDRIKRLSQENRELFLSKVEEAGDLNSKEIVSLINGDYHNPRMITPKIKNEEKQPETAKLETKKGDNAKSDKKGDEVAKDQKSTKPDPKVTEKDKKYDPKKKITFAEAERLRKADPFRQRPTNVVGSSKTTGRDPFRRVETKPKPQVFDKRGSVAKNLPAKKPNTAKK